MPRGRYSGMAREISSDRRTARQGALVRLARLRNSPVEKRIASAKRLNTGRNSITVEKPQGLYTSQMVLVASRWNYEGKRRTNARTCFPSPSSLTLSLSLSLFLSASTLPSRSIRLNRIYLFDLFIWPDPVASHRSPPSFPRSRPDGNLMQVRCVERSRFALYWNASAVAAARIIWDSSRCSGPSHL